MCHAWDRLSWRFAQDDSGLRVFIEVQETLTQKRPFHRRVQHGTPSGEADLRAELPAERGPSLRSGFRLAARTPPNASGLERSDRKEDPSCLAAAGVCASTHKW